MSKNKVLWADIEPQFSDLKKLAEGKVFPEGGSVQQWFEHEKIVLELRLKIQINPDTIYKHLEGMKNEIEKLPNLKPAASSSQTKGHTERTPHAGPLPLPRSRRKEEPVKEEPDQLLTALVQLARDRDFSELSTTEERWVEGHIGMLKLMKKAGMSLATFESYIDKLIQEVEKLPKLTQNVVKMSIEESDVKVLQQVTGEYAKALQLNHKTKTFDAEGSQVSLIQDKDKEIEIRLVNIKGTANLWLRCPVKKENQGVALLVGLCKQLKAASEGVTVQVMVDKTQAGDVKTQLSKSGVSDVKLSSPSIRASK